MSVDVAPNADAVTVLINGRPGSGKSTLAPRLGAALGLPTISQDAIKETHATVAKWVDTPRWQLSDGQPADLSD